MMILSDFFRAKANVGLIDGQWLSQEIFGRKLGV